MTQHATLLVATSRVDEGMAVLAQVLATQTRVLGSEHPETRQTQLLLDIYFFRDHRVYHDGSPLLILGSRAAPSASLLVES
mmetsp:Transcript_26050/g.104238  ORF Transcript_26050/g.104238 Transcript_26050/m.104238 type:complete len:81 (-) Transcript_26050:333-575(-)